MGHGKRGPRVLDKESWLGVWNARTLDPLFLFVYFSSPLLP